MDNYYIQFVHYVIEDIHWENFGFVYGTKPKYFSLRMARYIVRRHAAEYNHSDFQYYKILKG